MRTRRQPVSLDVANASLRRGAQRIALRRKDFDVLRHLIAHRGRLVTKADLMDAAWPGVVVAEGVLKASVTRLRAALGDDARNPGFIETVHGRGYRLTGRIALLDEAEDETQSPETRDGQGGPRPGGIVGREAELAALERSFSRAAAGERQVVLVTGEAGLGKTALIDAFVQSLPAARRSPASGLRVARGQCVEHYGPGEAYMPVLEALGQLCRGPTGRAMVRHLARHAPTWLAQMPGLVSSAEFKTLTRRTAGASRDRMLRELADALDTLGRTASVILVLEDLHWSDVSTLDLLSTLARRRAPARLLVLATYRPEDLLPREHPLPVVVRDLSLRGLAVELPLLPLSEAAVEAYLGLRFPGAALPPAVARAVHRRTDGHPLFLVALAEHWIAHELVVESRGAWQARADLQSLERGVPANVRRMIEVRLRRLSARERRLVEAASVAGLEFPAASVAAALDETPADIDERCADLARRGLLLRACGEERWPDGTVAGRYGFVHAVYRDVIHEQVPVARRVDLHRRVATREEAGHRGVTGAIAARLAMHFEQGHDHRSAARHRLQAARNAIERGGYHEAIAHGLAGFEVLRHLPDDRSTKEQAIDLHFELRHALLPLGQHPQILDHLRQAEALAEALDDRARLGRASAYLTACFRQNGVLDQSVAYGERALALATAAGDFPLQALANYYLGYACHDLGDYRRALDCLGRNVASLVGEWLHERFGIPGLVSVLSRGQLSSATAELGAFAEGAARGEEAVRIAESVDHPFSLAVACYGLGDLYLRQGRLPEATRTLERGLRLCRVASIHTWAPTLGAALGHAYALSGRLADALPLLRQAVEQAAAMSVSAIQSRRLAYLSAACMLDARLAEAFSLAEDALALARDLEARGYEAHALCNLGDVCARRGRSELETAEEAYRQALTIAGELGMRPLAAHCHLGLGRLLRGTGRGAEARASLLGAVGLFRDLDMAFWLARAEAELARWREA